MRQITCTLIATVIGFAGFVSATTAKAGVITQGTFSSDAGTGVGTVNGTQSGGVNFNNSTATTLNGVSFQADTTHSGTIAGTSIGYALTGAPDPHSGGQSLISPGVDALTTNFWYFGAGFTAGAQVETITFTGLSPNTSYLFSQYDTSFGSGTRSAIVSDSQIGTVGVTVDENANAGGSGPQGTFVRDLFTTGAAQTSIAITYTLENSGNSYHQYDFQLAVVTPEPSSVVLFGLAAVGLFVAVRRRRKV